MPKWVTIRNPDLGADSPTSEVLEEAFVQTWEPRGFQIVDPLAAKVGELLGAPVDDASTLPKKDLARAASLAGVPADGTKQDILSALGDALLSDEQRDAAESTPDTEEVG